jgi:hypothetical protein
LLILVNDNSYHSAFLWNLFYRSFWCEFNKSISIEVFFLLFSGCHLKMKLKPFPVSYYLLLIAWFDPLTKKKFWKKKTFKINLFLNYNVTIKNYWWDEVVVCIAISNNHYWSDSFFEILFFDLSNLLFTVLLILIQC